MLIVMSRKIWNILFILFIIARFIFMIIYQVPKSLSSAIGTDPPPRNFTTINPYFYVLRHYSAYSQIRESVGYPNHDSTRDYCPTQGPIDVQDCRSQQGRQMQQSTGVTLFVTEETY